MIMGSGYLTYHGVKKDYSAFKARVDDSLTEVTAEMWDGVTKIYKYAFYYCSALTSVIIPSSVTLIGNSAFYGCSSLASVTVEATTPPTLGVNAFKALMQT